MYCKFLFIFLYCFCIISSTQAQDTPPEGYREVEVSVNGRFYPLYLKVHNQQRHKNHRQIVKNDMVKFHMVIKNHKDSILRTTYPNKPIIKEINTEDYTTADKGFMEEMLNRIFVGDSATYLVKSDYVFEAMRKKRPPFVPQGSYVKYIFKLLKIETLAEIELEKKDKIFKQGQTDDKIIAQYVSKNKIKAKRTYNGVWYMLDSIGNGEFAKQGDVVEINYKGKLLNGKVFAERNNYEFPVGENFVLKGWEDFIVLLKEGGRGMCIIPSTLAHGEQGVEGLIPPNTPLIFEMEFLKVKRRKIIIEKKEGGIIPPNKVSETTPEKRLDYKKDDKFKELEKTYQLPKKPKN